MTQAGAVRNPDFPHLPAGRQPGPQSRRRRVASSALKVVGPVVAGGCGLSIYIPLVIGAVVLLVAAISDGAAVGGWVAALVLLALVVAAPFVAWQVYRRVRPADSGHLALSVATSDVARGERIQARLRVSDLDRLTDLAQVGLVCMCWYDKEVTRLEDGHRRTRRVTQQTTEYERWEPASRQADQSFELEVPAGAPFSHEGEVLTFAWRVSARESKARAADPRADVPVWVRP